MASPALDTLDLQLLVAVADTGSIGAAARSLRLTQPSASSRLTRAERRLGVRLFDRSTTGARATRAGAALVDRSRRALDVVAAGVAEARTAAGRPQVLIGAIATLAPAVFATLDETLAERAVLIQRVDHGRQLLTAVLDGALDAAVVALPATRLPSSGVRRVVLGTDPLVLLQPAGAGPAGDLRGRDVVVHSASGDADVLLGRLVRAGAVPRTAATAHTALAMARRSGSLALLPASAVQSDRRPDEHVQGSPLRWPVTVSLIVADVPGPGTDLLEAASSALADLFGGRPV
jgi:DNA-binding transcriptional LysR family regulator